MKASVHQLEITFDIKEANYEDVLVYTELLRRELVKQWEYAHNKKWEKPETTKFK